MVREKRKFGVVVVVHGPWTFFSPPNVNSKNAVLISWQGFSILQKTRLEPETNKTPHTAGYICGRRGNFSCALIFGFLLFLFYLWERNSSFTFKTVHCFTEPSGLTRLGSVRSLPILGWLLSSLLLQDPCQTIDFAVNLASSHDTNDNTAKFLS